MFKLYARKNELAVRDREPLTSGSVNVNRVEFAFSPEWEGLTKTAVFRAGKVTRELLLPDSLECLIPWEVLEKSGEQLYAGVCGTRGGELVLPTVWAHLGTVQEGDTYTIPKGYHNGSGTVSGVAGGGNYNLQSKAVTPTKLQQNVTPDSGFYGLSDVTVAPIPESYADVSAVTAEAADVLTGKVIVSAAGKAVTGSMPNNGLLEKSIDGLTSMTADLPAGYYSGGTVTLSGDIEEALAKI